MRLTKIFFIAAALFLSALIRPLCGQLTERDFVDRMFRVSPDTQLIPDFTDSYGVVFRDLNGDRRPDLYVVRFRNLNRLFINRGPHGMFEDWTIQSGLGGNLMPMGKRNLELGGAAGDVNNDGRVDVAIAGWGVSSRLFLQRKGLVFTDITAGTDIRPPLDGNGAFFADVNLDGNLDLFITDEHHPNHLYLGDGCGGFRDVSRAWGVADSAVSQGAAFADVDGDGFPDLYVCNWFAPDFFYKNMNGQKFRRITLPLLHLTDSLNSNGVVFGDVDNDGDGDLLVTDRNRRTRLYRNDTPADSSAWAFTDITDQAGLKVAYPAYGAIIGDVNNDGWQDVWINTIGPNMLFLNRGGARFRKVFQQVQKSWHPKKHYSTGAASADLDLDGDLDLFVANKDTNSILYVNPVNTRRFIELQLEGVRANRDAIGARVWLYRDSGDSSVLVGYREIRAGGGYLSENSPVVHFGLPAVGRYRARILFPGGAERMERDLQAGHRYFVREFEGASRFYYRAMQFLTRSLHQPYFALNVLLFLLLLVLLWLYLLLAMHRYRWAVRQITYFLVLIVLLLYGFFLIMRDSPLHVRLFLQVLLLALTTGMLSLFLEKIRRLEVRRQEYRDLLRSFSRDLISLKNNRELFRTLCDTLHKTVQPPFCAIYFATNQHLAKESQQGKADLPDTWHVSARLMEKDMFVIPEDVLPEEAASLPPCYGFPLRRGQRNYGVLLIGRLKGRADFSPDDLDVFRTLAVQAAIAVENNLYIEETKHLIQQITEAETRERYVRELEEKNRTLQQLYSDLKNAQMQLVQSEKMASLGQLVAGIAHELNNPISYIYANMKELQNYLTAINLLLKVIVEKEGSADFDTELSRTLREIKEKYDLEFIQDDLQSLISESIEGSQRVKNVVQNLRNFSRLDEADFKEVDIHEGLESTLLLLNNELKNRITVHKSYGNLPRIYCHAGHLNQVFMNLLLNAVQAIREQGNIWISTRREGDEIVIEIRDDGKGIPEEALPKIFDPFFTTKPVGQGTGLGLSISYNIIREHGGTIEVESEVDRGTRFRIRLPIRSPGKGRD